MPEIITVEGVRAAAAALREAADAMEAAPGPRWAHPETVLAEAAWLRDRADALRPPEPEVAAPTPLERFATPAAIEHWETQEADRRKHNDHGCRCPLCEVMALLAAASADPTTEDVTPGLRSAIAERLDDHMQETYGMVLGTPDRDVLVDAALAVTRAEFGTDRCDHPSSTGVDAVGIGDPNKVWRCDVCGLRWSAGGDEREPDDVTFEWPRYALPAGDTPDEPYVRHPRNSS